MNEVIFDGIVYNLCIIEISDDGIVKAWGKFTEEQPYTEWLGGSAEIKADAGGYLRVYKNGNLIK